MCRLTGLAIDLGRDHADQSAALPKVIAGVRFQDVIEVMKVPANRAA
jgi:hypothetical protein